MSDKVDWNDAANDAVVVPTTQGIAVYVSDSGYLVVTQEGFNGEDDQTILVHPRDIERFAVAVQVCVKNHA